MTLFRPPFPTGADAEELAGLLLQNPTPRTPLPKSESYINHLKTGNVYDERDKKLSQRKINVVLDDILTIKGPLRGEWLDAQFSIGQHELNISYHRADGTLFTHPFANYLALDKIPGIDLEEWLQKATVHGLPRQNASLGTMCYWKPTTDRVVRFSVDADRGYLNCQAMPEDLDPPIGVRPARVRRMVGGISCTSD